jgi:hypothetical protein
MEIAPASCNTRPPVNPTPIAAVSAAATAPVKTIRFIFAP